MRQLFGESRGLGRVELDDASCCTPSAIPTG
jgi:hypothetical protein